MKLAYFLDTDYSKTETKYLPVSIIIFRGLVEDMANLSNLEHDHALEAICMVYNSSCRVNIDYRHVTGTIGAPNGPHLKDDNPTLVIETLSCLDASLPPLSSYLEDTSLSAESSHPQ
jgi:hypothetical protein